MSGYILRDSEPSIVLTADQVDRLVKNGDGDAALLYLLLMRADRGVTEQELQSRLRWSQLRLNAAEGALQRLGLIQRPAETPAPAPAEERPVYSAQDLAQLLEDDRSFRMLIPQVEEKLDQSRTAREQRSAAMRDRIEQGREAGAQRLAALKESFSNMLEERSFGQKRLMNAFPHLKSSEHQAALEALREKEQAGVR